MWLCIGPFDSEVSGVINFSKTKLLKPATEYVLGRKEGRPLRLNHKQISHEHIAITVGEYTEEDVENPGARPSLTIHNLSTKLRKVVRGELEITLNPNSQHELQDGDLIHVLNGVPISVRWESICCLYSPPRDPATFRIQDCAKLGVSVVLTPNPSVTHHLTTNYSLTPPIATSLLSAAHLVKPDWLTALIQSGTSPNKPSPLEFTFTLPRIADFRPDYSLSVPSTLRTLRTWEPNEARLNMLKEYRVVFVGEKGREVTLELRELVKRGGGEYECCAVEGGKKALHGVLAKGKGKGKNLVLIADEPAMGAAVGQDGWMELVREASDFRLRFIRPEKLTQSVVHVDYSYIDCAMEPQEGHTDAHRFSSPLPDVVPNTHIEEPTLAPQTMAPQVAAPPPEPEPESPRQPTPPRRLIRRAPASRAPSVPPVKPPSESSVTKAADQAGNVDKPTPAAEEEPPLPRRLPRRANREKKLFLGVDDPSISIDGSTPILPRLGEMSAPIAPAAKPIRSETQSSPPRVTRLKRRAGTQQATQAFTTQLPPPEEPPLKKFKGLFEASDPDKIAQSGMEEYKNMFKTQEVPSQTQPETPLSVIGSSKAGGSAGAGTALRGLDVVPEEEEETTQTQARTRRSKRKAPGGSDEDVEMGDEEPVRLKRRAVEGANAVARSQANNGIQPRSTSKPPSSKLLSKTQSSRPDSSAKSGAGASTSSGTAAGHTGAQPGKPDKDSAFLKAVASTKRGKKHEDEFDREFNKLKISKPDLAKEDEARRREREYAVLEEFGYDGDLRGNFMVVVEIEVKERKRGESGYRRGDGEGVRQEWVGRPDFKKFKRKVVGERPKPVDLYVEDESGFAELWTGGISTDPTLTPADPKGKKPKSSTSLAGTSRTNTAQRRVVQPVMDDDDDDIPPPTMTKLTRRSATPASQLVTDKSKPIRGGSKPPSSTIHTSRKPDSSSSSKTTRSATATATATKTTRSTRAGASSSKKTQALFIDSDDDEGENFAKALEAVSEEDEDEYRDAGETLGTNGRTVTQDTRGGTGAKTRGGVGARGATKRGAAKKVMDDDSDDGVTFKGFGAKKGKRRV